MKTRAIPWLCAALLAASVTAAAQERGPAWDCTDLNDTVPFGQSSVYSLAELPNGLVLGGCGGSAAHLILYDPNNRAVRILKSWDRPGCVRNLLVRGERFWMVVGGEPATMVPDQAQVEDEHLFGGTVAGAQVVLTDCGTPIAGEGITCLAADAEGKSIFGVTRALVVAPAGEVYGAFGGVLFRWTPDQADAAGQKPAALTVLHQLAVPAASDRAGTEGTCVECLVWTADGRLFGGTYDGYPFRADPAAGRIVNLGKPFRQSNIRTLAETKQGDLLGLCGEVTGRCRLFSYSDRDGYREVAIGSSSTYFPNDGLGALLFGRDGTIYIGGKGRMGALYVRRAPAAPAEGAQGR